MLHVNSCISSSSAILYQEQLSLVGEDQCITFWDNLVTAVGWNMIYMAAFNNTFWLFFLCVVGYIHTNIHTFWHLSVQLHFVKKVFPENAILITFKNTPMWSEIAIFLDWIEWKCCFTWFLLLCMFQNQNCFFSLLVFCITMNEIKVQKLARICHLVGEIDFMSTLLRGRLFCGGQ